MKFDPTGRLLDVYTGAFNIVHSVTLMEEKDALCVADREHSRIVCIHAGLKQGPGQPTFGSPYGSAGHKGKNVGRVFAVAAKGTEIKPPVNSPRAKEKNTTALTTQTLVKYPHADGHFFSFCVSQASSSTLFSDPFSWACLTARHSTWIVWTPCLAGLLPMYVLCISFIVSVPKLFIVSLLTWFNYCFSFLTVYPGIWQSSRCRRVSGRWGSLRRSNRSQQHPQIRPRMKHKFLIIHSSIKKETRTFSDVSNQSFKLYCTVKKKIYKLYKTIWCWRWKINNSPPFDVVDNTISWIFYSFNFCDSQLNVTPWFTVSKEFFFFLTNQVLFRVQRVSILNDSTKIVSIIIFFKDSGDRGREKRKKRSKQIFKRGKGNF